VKAIVHYLTTQKQLTDTDKLILRFIHDAGAEGTTILNLTDLCGTLPRHMRTRIRGMKRAGMLSRVSPGHFTIAKPDPMRPCASQMSPTATVPVPIANLEAA